MKLRFKRDWAMKLADDVTEPETIGPVSEFSEILAEHSRSEAESKWELFPLNELGKLGWLGKPLNELGDDAREVVKNYLKTLIIPNTSIAYFRRNDNRQGELEKLKTWLWLTRLQTIAASIELAALEFRELSVKETINIGRELVQLSVHEDGPRRAIDYLAQKGIVVIVERTLPGSYLDGAAFLSQSGNPVIGLALRFDRVDYFWFTLVHEFVHSVRHVFDASAEPFVENLDDIENSRDSVEQEANAIASDCLIPRVVWRRSDAYRKPGKDAILRLANELRIHPAIIAGRLRRDMGRYDLFSEFVGQNQVRQLFDSVVWEG